MKVFLINEGLPVTSGDNGANFTCLVANPAIQVMKVYGSLFLTFNPDMQVMKVNKSMLYLSNFSSVQGRNISRKFNLNVLCKFPSL